MAPSSKMKQSKSIILKGILLYFRKRVLLGVVDGLKRPRSCMMGGFVLNDEWGSCDTISLF